MTRDQLITLFRTAFEDETFRSSMWGRPFSVFEERGRQAAAEYLADGPVGKAVDQLVKARAHAAVLNGARAVQT